MSVASYLKGPGNVTLDYSLDWGSWLLQGETITTSTWAITSEAAPVETDLFVEVNESGPNTLITGGITTAWLTQGTVGTVYEAVNTLVTSAGRTDERSIQITIQAR